MELEDCLGVCFRAAAKNRECYVQAMSNMRIPMDAPHSSVLARTFAIQAQIRDIHPCFAELYPVVLSQGGRFFMYEPDPQHQRYTYIDSGPAPEWLSGDIFAAFPVEQWQGKMACVVSSHVLDTDEGYCVLFHEFVHCMQYDHCEGRLKSQLSVAQRAMREGRHTWELDHPFPYSDSIFEMLYIQFVNACRMNDRGGVLKLRHALAEHLDPADYEYLIWQEWKEGFARYLENKIRERLNLPENTSGLTQPHNRITFYIGGSFYIEHLIRQHPECHEDIEMLFEKMQTPAQI
jgi:hypothetical protein